MKEYPLVPLGTLISQAKTVRCGEVEYPVLSMTMHNGLVFQDEKFKKVIASKDRSNYKVVYRNQLVISFPIDEGVLAAQRITDAGIVSPAYGIWDINQEKVLPEFLEYALRCERALNYYKSKLRGSTARRRSLPTPTLLAFTVPLPPLDEQVHLLAIMHKLKHVIDKREKEINDLDELVKARFVELFGDLKINSKKWPVKSFTDIAKIDTKMIHDFRGYEAYPHIGIDSISKETGELHGYRTVKEDNIISGKYIFTPKHIIYSKIRPNLNKVAMPNFSGVCSADAYPILANEKECNREFLTYTLRSKVFLDYILMFAKRTNLPKVNKEQIEGFYCPIPSLYLQEKFKEILNVVDKSKLPSTAAL